MSIVVAVAAAASAYFWANRSRTPEAPAPAAAQQTHAMTPEQLAKLAEQLDARLRKKPEDAAAWVTLARSHIAVGRFDAASQAYEEAAKLRPDDADLLADYADVLAVARGRRLEGEPLKIIRRALEIDPAHLKALALAGSAEFEAKRYAEALAYWERILPLAGPDSDFGRSIRRSIARARELGPPVAASAEPAKPSAIARQSPVKPAAAPATRDGGADISGTVRLDPSLASKISPTDVVFIFARAAEGGRLPLSVVRVSAADLPYTFRMDGSEGAKPESRLSSHKSVILVARLSRTGNAIPKPGDLEGISQPLPPGSTGVELTIDKVRP